MDSDNEDAPAATTLPFAALGAAYAYESVTIILDSDDEDAANAAQSLADDSTLCSYSGKYFNIPIEDKAPLYYVTRGRYIGVFSGW